MLNIFSGHSAIKLEVNNKKNCGNYTNTWKLNNFLLNNQWPKEFKKEILKCFETNEHNIPSLWNTAKAGLKRHFIAIAVHIKKQKDLDKQLATSSQGARKIRTNQ
jgi:hypothetical protein